ncbi:MAG TPA: GNAT family N-acetyltransferase [Candidatus Acidoferrum sp.]|nr:GNAT family N-acetyltransferase [Candidatus Acidoferrum sp.]
MPQARTTNRMIVRTAGRDDAGPVAALTAQLGYDEAEDEIRRRIEEIHAPGNGEIYVAVVPPDIVVGWIQVFALLLVEMPPLAEVGGIVVDSRYRRIGVGRSLMEAAEQWARQNGLTTLRLRCGSRREEARDFCRRLGYREVAAATLFSKLL